MGFSVIAAARGITTAAAELEMLTWDVDSDGYQRIDLGDAPPLSALWNVMPRRGLDPKLVAPIVRAWPGRSIERALIAYDFLDKTLLSTDDSVVAAQLTHELQPLREIATTAAAVPRDKIGTLIAAVASGAAASEDFAALPSLAGLTGCIPLDEAAIEAVYSHARRLAASHLPSLAIAFMQILVERLALPRALELLVELALDADAVEAIPAISDPTLQTYLLGRIAISSFAPTACSQLLAAREQTGFAPELTVLEANLAVMQRQPLDPAAETLIAQIASAAPSWRYAQAVQSAVASASDPDSVVRNVDAYVLTFGNDPYVWAQAAICAEAHPGLLARLSQELRFGAFCPAAWRALSVIAGNPGIADEVHTRTTAQLTDALTAEPTDDGFPRFDVPHPLEGGGGHAWTARFDSLDLRNDTAYYKIRILEGDTIVARFMCAFSSGERDTKDDIRRAIAAVAATLTTNTEYAGTVDY